MKCLLATLHNPRLSHPLPGLRLSDEGELTLVTALFSCCGGEGLSYDSTQDGYVRCRLSERLQSVRKILRQFSATWGEPLVPSKLKPARSLRDFLAWLATYQQASTTMGKVFTSGNSPKQPSYELWLMALVASWRGGCDVHIVSLGRTKAPELLPPRSFAQQGPGVLFIEQKDVLWRPQAAFDLDTLINYCEGAMLPIWLDVLNCPEAAESDPSEGASPSLHTEDAFRARLSSIKQRPTLAWMGPAARSRLSSVCANSEEFFTGSSSER